MTIDIDDDDGDGHIIGIQHVDDMIFDFFSFS